MDTILLTLAAAALLARAGYALHSTGLVRAKNAGGTLLRHFADLSLAALSFWAVGIAVLNFRGASSFIQISALFGLRGDDVFYATGAFVILVATLVSTGIVVGALSERTRFWPSLAPSILLGGILVPLVARWTSASGWLTTRAGFHDCAGASFVHLTAATCAAVAAILVGPRNGKYNRDGSSNVIPGHSLPLAGAGAMFLLLSFLPYVLLFSGRYYNSVAGIVALNVLLAAAAGGLGGLAVSHFRFGKPDISLTIAGIIGALVAITAGADAVSNLAAVITGLIAGLVVPWSLLQIEMVWKIDDPTGAIAMHGIGAIWGLIATGIFAQVPTSTARFKLIVAQFLGVAVTIVLVAVATFVLFTLLKSKLRVSEADEFDGLDLAEHDIGSYPDFQQNTIKSYHLREA